MRFIVEGLAWYLALTSVGLAALPALCRWGLSGAAAAGIARIVGWTAIGYAGWLAGLLGWRHWWWAGIVAAAGLLLSGWRHVRRIAFHDFLAVEAVGLAAFVLLAWLRTPSLLVTATEKPMDLAILSTLLRPGVFPPPDPWLAGWTLPYYYWGFMPWVAAAKALQRAPDVAFNLLVPALGAVTAQAAWALARRLGANGPAALLAAFLPVFSGTPDGWRQLVTGTRLAALDAWRSSRQIAGTITEYPLFTFQLGDLHPHLLCVPLVLACLVLAQPLGAAAPVRRPPLALVALLYGAAAAANPWCALPLGLAVTLLVLTPAFEPGVDSARLWRRALRGAAVGALGWALYSPFWLRWSPPLGGLGWVHGATRWDELVSLLGGLLLPPALLAAAVAGNWGGAHPERRHLARAVWVVGAVAVALITGRVGLAVALAIITSLGWTALSGRDSPHRQAAALALVPLALVGLMEVAFVRDSYGPELYRMNTVFKATHLALLLLAVLAPVLLRAVRPRFAAVAAALLVLAGAPHLARDLDRAARTACPRGWGGLGWMAPGEADAARFLRRLPAGAVLVEAVGPAYSHAARFSATSGVPAVLGWENHQQVWRGPAINPELERRRREIERLYTCGDPGEVRRIAAALGATHVVIGGRERALAGEAGLEALRRAGTVVFSAAQCEVVSLGG
jgi:YYY domain-containing protein